MATSNKFHFNDDSLNHLVVSRKKHRREKKSFDSENGFSTSDVSLTYSSSSQAGESTDSSVSEGENRPGTHSQRVKNYHQRNNSQQQQLPQRGGGGMMCREVSNAADSLNYSEDEESLYRQQHFMDTTGQTSDSYGHDGGGHDIASQIYGKLTPIPATLDTTRFSRTTHHKSSKPHHSQDYSPNTMASSDVSLGSMGSSNPSSPPPRHRPVNKELGTEVWYAKWWMCGFTDALNINSNY